MPRFIRVTDQKDDSVYYINANYLVLVMPHERGSVIACAVENAKPAFVKESPTTIFSMIESVRA